MSMQSGRSRPEGNEGGRWQAFIFDPLTASLRCVGGTAALAERVRSQRGGLTSRVRAICSARVLRSAWVSVATRSRSLRRRPDGSSPRAQEGPGEAAGPRRMRRRRLAKRAGGCFLAF